MRATSSPTPHASRLPPWQVPARPSTPNPATPWPQTSDASKSTAIPTTGSKPVSFLADQAAATVTLSGGKKVDPSLKVNSDATLGPHHKPRHPRLPGSFYV